MTATAPPTTAPVRAPDTAAMLTQLNITELTVPERDVPGRAGPYLRSLRGRAAATVSTLITAVAAWAARSPRRRPRTFRHSGPADAPPLATFTANELRADLEASWRRS